MLSRIDRFLFSVEWEDHFQGVHQVILLKITSDHLPILLRVGEVSRGRHPFKCENMWLEVDGFSDLVKSFWDELNVYWPLELYVGKETKLFEDQT